MQFVFSLELRLVFQYFENLFFNCYWVGIPGFQVSCSQIIWRSQVINPNQRPKRSWRKGSTDFKTLSREVCSNINLLKIQNSKKSLIKFNKNFLTFGPFAAIDGLVDSHVVVTFWDIVDVFVSSDTVVVVSQMSPILTTWAHHLTKVLLINILSHFAERGT